MSHRMMRDVPKMDNAEGRMLETWPNERQNCALPPGGERRGWPRRERGRPRDHSRPFSPTNRELGGRRKWRI
jgi:hypothetical protein